MPGTADRKTGAQGGLAGDVEARGALLQGAAEYDIVDVGGVEPGALHGGADDMAGHGLALGVVESAPIGFANRRAGDGNDDGFTHLSLLLVGF